MIEIPQFIENFSPSNATVEFGKFTKEGIEYIVFDTSRCGPPEPMVNAMIGLSLLDSPKKKLIMINHKPPKGLYDKIGNEYAIEEHTLENGNTMILFSKRT
ncbi:MAG: hypothetical protein IE890_12110 [Arcobacter sp.]|nr:hypothetical protein [Arcobacter sp.]